MTHHSFQLYNVLLPVEFLVASRCNFLSKKNLKIYQQTETFKNPDMFWKISRSRKKNFFRKKVAFFALPSRFEYLKGFPFEFSFVLMSWRYFWNGTCLPFTLIIWKCYANCICWLCYISPFSKMWKMASFHVSY